MVYGIAAIGEALIDFIPDTKGVRLKEVEGFKRVCGGAPCNVCAAVAKLGGKSRMLTQLGNDAFGDYIVDTLTAVGVDLTEVRRTDAANTALAFVSLQKDGNRDFSFYRKPSADMLYSAEQITESCFDGMGALHFCSVDLIDCPMKQAHEKAIRLAQARRMLISFDPNIRLPLWSDHAACRETVLQFMAYADIVKISDDELEFILGESEIENAVTRLFDRYPNLKLVLFSKGKNGAQLFTKQHAISVKGASVEVSDTTGAGDAIIGAFLYCLGRDGVTPDALAALDAATLERYLSFANACAGYSVTKSGAIGAYGTLSEIEAFIESR